LLASARFIGNEAANGLECSTRVGGSQESCIVFESVIHEQQGNCFLPPRHDFFSLDVGALISLFCKCLSGQTLFKAFPISFRFMDDAKTSAPGSAEPQLRNGCLSLWSVKAELGRALGKLKSTRVKVPPVELDGSRPKAMSGMKP
jgi:hypothetical protein